MKTLAEKVMEARRGLNLDTYITDPSWLVRKAVADQGHGLDVLIHDPEWSVRYTVAKQGYGLDVLMNDPDQTVREIADVMRVRLSGINIRNIRTKEVQS